MLYLPWNGTWCTTAAVVSATSFVQAPNDIYDAYMKSRNDPQIVHYAGFRKPWTDPDWGFRFHVLEVRTRDPVL